jgi:hypothetical protein
LEGFDALALMAALENGEFNLLVLVHTQIADEALTAVFG